MESETAHLPRQGASKPETTLSGAAIFHEKPPGISWMSLYIRLISTPFSRMSLRISSRSRLLTGPGRTSLMGLSL
jgi:hypothetical protein